MVAGRGDAGPVAVPLSEASKGDLAYAYAPIEAAAAGAIWGRAAAEGLRQVGRIYWERVLRRTSLLPNTSIDGVVHAPLDAEANGVVLGERRLPFAFRQINIRP